MTRSHRVGRVVIGAALAGVLLGAGGFNLYDGTIQHKVLKRHEVRATASDELIYDIVFIGIALAVLAAGIFVLRSTWARSFQ